MTRKEQVSNGFTEMMKGFWGNQDLKVPDFEEPCKDCISREKAKQFLYERLDRFNNDELYDIFSRIIDDMYNELLSVTPQQNVGKWMIHPNGVYAHLVCSKCLTNAPYDCKTNYCPNCGAKMEVEECRK